MGWVLQVGESVAKPMLYYNNNIVGTCNLIECMRADPTCKKVRLIHTHAVKDLA